jgi:hypothetical protein
LKGTLFNTTNTIKTATYTVTPGLAGCGTDNSFTLTVTVYPTPEVTQITTTVCSGFSFVFTPTDGTNGIVPGNIRYNWLEPTYSNYLSDGISRSNQVDLNGTLRNASNVNQTATYVVTPSSGNCVGANFTLIVTVKPTAEIGQLSTVTCSGTPFEVSPTVGFVGNIVPAGTLYTWNAPASTPTFTGVTSGSNAASISGTIRNTTHVQQTITYTVRPLSGDCLGAVFSVVVTVNPTPEFVTLTTVTCSGIEFQVSPAAGFGTNIVPADTRYTWNAPSFTGSVTGGQSSQGIERTHIFGTLSNRTNTQQTVTYQVTPKALSGNCTGAAFTVVVTLNPTPEFVTLTTVTCSGVEFQVSPAVGVGGGNIVPANTLYTWTEPTFTGTVTGGQSSQGIERTSIFGTLSNRTNGQQTVTYQVTPRASSGNCTGAAFSVVVTLNPTPEFVTLSTVSCSGVEFQVSPAAVVGGGNIVPADTRYTWEAPSVTGTVTGGQSRFGV